jgi:hypothetical protein
MCRKHWVCDLYLVKETKTENLLCKYESTLLDNLSVHFTRNRLHSNITPVTTIANYCYVISSESIFIAPYFISIHKPQGTFLIPCKTYIAIELLLLSLAIIKTSWLSLWFEITVIIKFQYLSTGCNLWL